MARTIHCVECGVALNLPDQAVGRRLKCPRCGAKFTVGALPEASSRSGVDMPTPGPDSTFVLSHKASSLDIPVMPKADGDLRETFDLASLTGADAAPKKAGAGGTGGPGASGNHQAADALALFDDAPKAHRKKTGAEARSQARRCPTCGGVVPVGMSICQTCGLDLETGKRVGFDDDDLLPTTAPRSHGTPLLVAVIGGVCGALSVVLAVMALILWQKGVAGAQYFIPVAGFGVYAAVRFFQLKSVRLLLIALTIGAVVNVAAMIALPIYDANSEVPVEQRTVVSDDPDADVVAIKPITERLDTQRITTGVAILFLYSVICIFLLSPTVQKHFRR